MNIKGKLLLLIANGYIHLSTSKTYQHCVNDHQQNNEWYQEKSYYCTHWASNAIYINTTLCVIVHIEHQMPYTSIKHFVLFFTLNIKCHIHQYNTLCYCTHWASNALYINTTLCVIVHMEHQMSYTLMQHFVDWIEWWYICF